MFVLSLVKRKNKTYCKVTAFEYKNKTDFYFVFTIFSSFFPLFILQIIYETLNLLFLDTW
jgi:hypothetical protein